MNKLINKLSAGQAELKNERAKIVAEDIAAEIESKIVALEKRKRDITKNKIIHSDIGPTNTTSLRVVDEKFNSEEWVNKLFELEKELLLVEIDLKIANQIKKEWLDETN